MTDNVLRGSISTKKKVLTGAICAGDKPLSGTIPGTLEFHYLVDVPEYEGPYEVTPKVDAQTLETAGKVMKENIKVDKIPNNYGLISYNQDRIITIT